MKRLVYSPKVFAMVKTESGKVDLTQYVVRGNVNRVFDAVSTAELTIRNPRKKWTNPNNPDFPIFRPMDPITIYLSRFKDQPVQVFSGFLDSTPYLQLLPGVCTLKASCTLKRLQYTYVDAGLPFVQNYLADKGWIPAGNGDFVNAKATGKSNKGATPESAQIKDGGLKSLIVSVMKDIGNWQKDKIIVQPLPKEVIEVASEIFQANRTADKAAREDFLRFLEDFVGTTGGGGAVDGSGSNSGASAGPVPFQGGDTYTSTAYGPPWTGIQGNGITADGTDLRDGREAYIIAISQQSGTKLQLGDVVQIWPNPHNHKGTFKVADRLGTQAPPNQIDFYVWQGHNFAYNWGTRNVKVKKVN